MDYLLVRGNSVQLPIADGVVQCCATSPPYFGLRDYGLPPTSWPAIEYAPMPGLPPVAVPAMECCLGLESTPEAFVGHLVLVFREVRRVLRSDGVCWLNLGDSYCSTDKWGGGGNLEKNTVADDGTVPSWEAVRKKKPHLVRIKPKDLVGIPWRAAFALQADGWWLRSDVIWNKPNAMPEPVEDRPGKAHEAIFLLAKRPRYYYDRFAVIEKDSGKPSGNGYARDCRLSYQNTDGSIRGNPEPWKPGSGRNKRTVWTIATQPTKEAHFATWPTALVEPMILAGTSERGCCPMCRAPWVRLVEKDRKATRPGIDTKITAKMAGDTQTAESLGWNRATVIGNRDPERHVTETRTIGWKPSCSCDAGEPIPCLALDPFNGSGTTGEVARLHGRSYIGVDLNPSYLSEIATTRVEQGERPHKPRPRTRDKESLPLFA